MADRSHDIDKNLAFILELVLGIFGFLGIGHIYAGYIARGLVRLFGWLVLMTLGWVAVGFLSVCLVGILLVPVMIIAHIVVPLLSAFSLVRRLDRDLPENR